MRGAQIRTLATLKELHKRHEICFAALNDPGNREGPERSGEYSSRHIAVSHRAPARTSPAIIPQLVGSLLNPVPLAVSRYASATLKRQVSALLAANRFDCIVCDFLAAAPNMPALPDCLLFEHNVETTIFERHVEQCTSFLGKAFFSMQAAKMRAYERRVCREAKHVIAVSDKDAERMKQMFGVQHVTSVPTGVDLDYFAPGQGEAIRSDMLFCGSMDWLPNVDAVVHFVTEILPLVRKVIPNATFTIAGRSPDARIFKAVQSLSGVTVSGTVADMRPYLWGAGISVVPLRIGGGTRLKIYESMAAGTPVVSTSIGAEGLRYKRGKDLIIADSPGDFASACIQLLTNEERRNNLASEARAYAVRELSWDAVSRHFEAILADNCISLATVGCA